MVWLSIPYWTFTYATCLRRTAHFSWLFPRQIATFSLLLPSLGCPRPSAHPCSAQATQYRWELNELCHCFPIPLAYLLPSEPGTSWSELVSSSGRTCECHLTITTLPSACVIFCKHLSSQKAKPVRRERYYFHPWLQSNVWKHCLPNVIEGGFGIPSSSSELSCLGAATFPSPVMGTGQCKCVLPVDSSALALSNAGIPLGNNQSNSHGQASCWPFLRACYQESWHWGKNNLSCEVPSSPGLTLAIFSAHLGWHYQQ